MRLLSSHCRLQGSLLAAWVLSLAVTDGRAADGALAKQLNDQLANVVEQASDSVVVIFVDKPGWSGPEMGDLPPETFRDPESRRRGLPRSRRLEAQGSGFILRKDGYILTNYHVVENASKIEVRLRDGRSFPASVRGIDDKTDLAVIRVEAEDLPAARLGNSDNLRVGEFAIAIGAPYSLDYTVTVGVISQKHRSGLGMAAYEDFLQTDAKINPGNSGGPLLNIDGEVIGVNTLIRGLRTDIGFAIPINLAREIAEKLIAEGKVVRPWVGVGFKYLSADRELQSYLGGSGKEIVVDILHPNTPAAQSALRPADIILSVAGTPVRTPRDVQAAVLQCKPGETVVFEVLRGKKRLQIPVTTGEMPRQSYQPPPVAAAISRPSNRSPTRGNLGLTVQSLDKVPREQLNLNLARGLFVSATELGGPAEQAGIQHGDIIVEVNHRPVETVEQFEAMIADADLSHGVLLFFNRQGTVSYALVKAPTED